MFMFVVDRIENDIAVIEFEGSYINVPLNAFREPISEGDILYLVVDKKKTEETQQSNKDRLFKLFERG